MKKTWVSHGEEEVPYKNDFLYGWCKGIIYTLIYLTVSIIVWLLIYHPMIAMASLPVLLVFKVLVGLPVQEKVSDKII
jgi:hypothetical protein